MDQMWSRIVEEVRQEDQAKKVAARQQQKQVKKKPSGPTPVSQVSQFQKHPLRKAPHKIQDDPQAFEEEEDDDDADGLEEGYPDEDEHVEEVVRRKRKGPSYLPPPPPASKRQALEAPPPPPTARTKSLVRTSIKNPFYTRRTRTVADSVTGLKDLGGVIQNLPRDSYVTVLQNMKKDTLLDLLNVAKGVTDATSELYCELSQDEISESRKHFPGITALFKCRTPSELRQTAGEHPEVIEHLTDLASKFEAAT